MSSELELDMSEDLKVILEECRDGHLAIVGGQLIEPDPDEVPFVLILDKELYNSLFAIAAVEGKDPEQLVLGKIQDIVESHESEEVDYFDKVAEDYDHQLSDGDIDMWADGDEPPPTDDVEEMAGVVGWGTGTVSDKRNPTVANREKIDRIARVGPFDNFKKLLSMVHGRADEIEITLRFNSPGEIELYINYSEDGMTVEEIEDGGLEAALSKINKHMRKFYDIAFRPKLEADSEITASLGAKIVEFDKTLGKYLVQIGDDMFLHISPEDVHKL